MKFLLFTLLTVVGIPAAADDIHSGTYGPIDCRTSQFQCKINCSPGDANYCPMLVAWESTDAAYYSRAITGLNIIFDGGQAILACPKSGTGGTCSSGQTLGPVTFIENNGTYAVVMSDAAYQALNSLPNL
ncbi:hypothetical protein TRVA0_042S01222 [Trichomonascus vanleenenianus]|uniref:uncharacterized protein n=1 Tax=Trichomonascus vanleenenianus TaxID=2268995 RepID=UPI003EC99D9A